MNSSMNRRGRRGFTLIEVGIAITLGAIVTAGATTMLIGLTRSNAAVRQRLEQIAVRSHLADVFRADVAGSESCTALDDKQPETGVVLHTDDQHSVRYVTGENDVQRIAQTGDHVDTRETFYLGDRHRATLTITADSPPVVRCTIQQMDAFAEPEKQPVQTKPRSALVFSAVLGRSHRLAETLRQVSTQAKATQEKAAPDPAPATEAPAP